MAIDASLDARKASEKTLKIENTEKRDVLIETEKKYQKAWAESHVFETDAPTTAEVPFHSVSPADLREQQPKFMGTIAYPYMNGTLHAGHAFTISKVEFATGWARMQGKRALFPQGFHCTGMAIKACADKLAREIEMFGPNFEEYKEEEVTEEIPAPIQSVTKEDVTKFASKKGKTAAKSVKAKYQFQIMLSLGIPREEIKKFADSRHWIDVFPETGRHHMTSFGLRIDWRRTFVTTDANPYYDSFVRWQMNRLKELGKIKFGKRYTVYSPKDGQPCLDHDRSSGEGINPQEYTGIKLKVVVWADAAKPKLEKLPSGSNVYFIAATLRPETMYGQNCCFVGPSINYGIFKVAEGEYFFCSDRAARNMAFQNIFPEWGVVEKLGELSGKDVIGTVVNAPLSAYKDVRILPMETVKASKGTGVVTSVPSDSPDDYATTMDLAKKADYYGINREWVITDILPIIESPKYGNLIAKTLVEQMKINSPKDPKLPEAKEEAYKEGFYNGTMIYGEFAGRPVSEAKELVKQFLIKTGSAFNYAEPDGLVISRSADECVAALLDQWFLNYGTTENGGDGAWCEKVVNHVKSDRVNTFSPEAKHQFMSTLGWLSQWACARSYGLGSKLPWDPKFLVESLSDSTIYPSYYTVAHYLHSGLFGEKPGLGNVKVEQMTDEVWDYIFARTDDVDSTIPKETLQAMRREFEYWYPLDLRVSGKDLIQNHLTFFLYVHVALFAEEYWPRGIRPNGHLMLNGEKMSKSTGNFLTLTEAVEKFGADATRLAIADAGDAVEDANFEESVANSIILKLYELRKWCEEMVNDVHLIKSVEEYRASRDDKQVKNIDVVQRTGELGFWDRLFANEMAALVQETKEHNDAYLWKNAVKSGFYDFTAARDFYREATKSAGVGMHHDLVLQYIELQALLLTVVAPHWAEYIWLDVLKKSDTIQNARYPDAAPVDPGLSAARAYIRVTTSNITSAEGAQQKRLAKGKASKYDPSAPKRLTIYFATAFPTWQDQYMSFIQESFDKLGLVDVPSISKKIEKKDMKKAMPFIQSVKKRLDAGESRSEVFNRKLPFDEEAVLTEMVPALKQVVRKCEDVVVVTVKPGESVPQGAENAVPGNPAFNFENI
ncbi:leucyl-tRNA synthetase [Lojkania enalia]|uniref:leucine--tRNA ligase n=1 Tax=Lojkania enalia TaxID=147567 RepID=A0A9P4K4M5_9PLEO|nr:leucyl-tRNA synthetase [Didymosphaeria enalia]